jgi:hypothetical protein
LKNHEIMTAFLRTELFSTNTKLEEHLIHLLLAYKKSVAEKSYAERSPTDVQPYAFIQTGYVSTGDSTTHRFLVARVAIPLDPNGEAGTDPLWAQAQEVEAPLTLPVGYRATS